MISEPASNALLYDIGVGNSWLMTLYMQWQVVLTGFRFVVNFAAM